MAGGTTVGGRTPIAAGVRVDACAVPTTDGDCGDGSLCLWETDRTPGTPGDFSGAAGAVGIAVTPRDIRGGAAVTGAVDAA